MRARGECSEGATVTGEEGRTDGLLQTERDHWAEGDSSSSSSSSASSVSSEEAEEMEDGGEPVEDGCGPQEVQEELLEEVQEAEVEAVAVEAAVPSSVHTWCEDPSHLHYRRSYQYQVTSSGHSIGSRISGLCSKIGRRLGKNTAPVSVRRAR